MKTIFDESTVTEFISRINTVSDNSKAQWGKMTAFQMMRHCSLSDEMFLSNKQHKRLFISRLFGKMALNSILNSSGPVKKNMPTHPTLKITGTGDLEIEKAKWISGLKGYKHYSNHQFVHPFFGPMSMDQIGQFVYKHIDHHLKQFGN